MPCFQTVRGKLLQKAASTVYNCSMSTASMSYFDKFDGVMKLLGLMEVPNERLKMTVLFALAYLIDEKNNHLIVSTNGKSSLTGSQYLFTAYIKVHIST